MLTKSTRLTIIGFLLLGILLGLFFGYEGGIVIKTKVKEMAQNSTVNSENGAPVKSFTTTIQASQRELLFDQLHRFAKKNFFAIRITSYPSSYDIEMWREDIEIFGSFENDDKILSISLNHNQFEQPVSESVFDDLMNDLQIFIGE